MNFERRLRDHFAAAAQRLPDPGDSLAEVARRGRRRRTATRAATAVGVLLVAVAVPAVLGAFDRGTVEFDPVAPPPGTATPTPTATPDATPTPTPEPAPTPSPSPGATTPPPPEGEQARETVAPGELPAPVLAYGPERDDLALIDRDGEQQVWPGPVDAAYPDGSGGVVLQPASQAALVWLPEAGEDRQVTLAEAEGELVARGLLPDGRALYSVRPDPEAVTEGDAEEFFAVALEEGAAPEPVATSGAYESWTVGPAFAADRQPVHAGCHLHCSLWPGLAEAPADGEALYQGLAVEGLTATPDGRVLAFVEFDLVLLEDGRPPELVLLAGTSFAELGRVALPLPPGEPVGTPTVSLSADGQRALVSLGSAAAPPTVAPPTTPYLVDGAIGDEPEVRAVDFEGALRWADPVAASGPGGPVTAEERDAAERLMAFASDPGEGTFAEVPLAAEVGLGLGPELVGAPRPASELADPAAWELDPAGGFRAYAGPFSALDVLAGAGEVAVAGGPHRHCANPPTPVPAEVAGLRQVSIQAADAESCLEWFTVDLFLDEAGEVAAVTLDLWEP